MMNMKIDNNNATFSLRVAENGVAWLAMDVPNEKMNLLRSSFVEQISPLLKELEDNPKIKGMVFYSAKVNCFIAGADINMLNACKSVEQAQAIAKQGQQLFSRLEQLPFHVVAAIHGPCLGGGLELALACHSRVATDDNITRLGLPEVQLGLLPGSGGTQRLPRLIGMISALDLILTGKQLLAKKALKLGVVDDVVSYSILFDVAEQLALKPKPKRHLGWQDRLIADNPIGRTIAFNLANKKTYLKTRGNYPATVAILKVIKEGLEQGIEKGLALEARSFGELVISHESAALRKLFFATTAMKSEMTKMIQQIKVGDIKNVAILGGGLMGAGIAYVSAIKANTFVEIKDINNDGILHAMRYCYNLLNKKYQRGQLPFTKLEFEMGKIRGTTDVKELHRSHIVIEAVFEDLDLKQQMVAEIEALNKETIFATNTSSLPISKIAQKATHPENIVGLHYFSPVEKMPLVEIIPHSKTSEKTIATVVQLAIKQGKTPIIVQDKAGFYVNRILSPYMNEAAYILLMGESIEHIDNALLDFGFPIGPVSLLDEVGLDVGAKISPILSQELGERFRAPDVFDAMLKDGRKGRKIEKGFYLYKNKSKKADNRVYSLLGIKLKPQLSRYILAQRCVLMMLNEAARCLDEGVIKSPRDGDIGAVFGIGFPPFLGGPFCYMDQIGITRVVQLLEKYQANYGERFAPCQRLKEMAIKKLSFYSNEFSN